MKVDLESANVSAVLFVKDLKRAENFYCGALSMSCSDRDERHSILNYRGFNLIVHQIPKHIANDITIYSPPARRVEGAIRLNFPVQSIAHARHRSRELERRICIQENSQ